MDIDKAIAKMLLKSLGRKFSHKQPIKAVKMEFDFTIDNIAGQNGDWLIQGADGDFKTVKADKFNNLYWPYRKPRSK